jgi:hypothetical protein
VTGFEMLPVLRVTSKTVTARMLNPRRQDSLLIPPFLPAHG